MRKITCNLSETFAFRSYKWASSLLLTLSLATAVTTARAEDKAKEPEPPIPVQDHQERIKIDIVRDRKNRGSYNSKTDRVSLTIKLTNQDPAKEFKDLKAIFIIIAQNLAEKKRFVALAREDFPVKLGKGTADREMEHQTKEATTSYYDYRNYETGDQYDGWAIALVNADGKIVAYKASNESYEQNIGKIDNIKAQSWFDLHFDPVERAYSSNQPTP